MLASGTKLGPYTVLDPLGRGGMGEVYLARDTRLDRVVAIKALPPALAGNPEAMGRFLREAKILASLNHPGISTLYGIEEVEGDRFLVLERIEGETLAERLRRGPLAVPDALEVGRKIAAALEAAHERGIVHRDLKPGNVMITPRGDVKVLDFGLAIRAAATREFASLNSSLASPGETVGTPGYMSPEQVMAQPQDERTDVFAFGCVLFECVSGRRAFGGASLLEVLTAILKAEPPWEALAEDSPASLRALLARCLAKDLGLRSSSMREVLLELDRIRQGDETIRPSPAPRSPHNLPRPATSFIGRERETAECLALARESRLLTLTGVGGCGKSRLALHLAGQLLDEFADGVWYADLAPHAEAMRVPEILVAAIGIHEEPDRTPLATLAAYLASRRTLLVLDNADNMLEGAGDVARTLLDQSPSLLVLVTSREPLGIPGERVQPVTSLAFPGSGAARSEAERSDAVRLFVERATFVDPSFRLTDESAATIVEICRRLDGIALAIELAAARVKVLAPEQILARLDDRFRLLTGGSRAALPRHQTLRAAMQWSYDQLVDDEKAAFRRLSVFSGGWTLESATAVCGEGLDEFEMLDVVTRLVDKSLVVAERSGGGAEARYRFLETVRQYAMEVLGEEAEHAAVADRHLEHFLGLAETAAPELAGPHPATWLSRLETEHENFLAALAWCERTAAGASRALRLATALYRFWYVRGHLTRGRECLTKALRLSGAGGPSRERAQALNDVATLAVLQGDGVAAKPWYEESLLLYRQLGEQAGIARALSGLGTALSMLEDYDTARACYEQSLAISREIGDTRGASIAINNLGDVAMHRGDYAGARRLLEESLDLTRAAGDEAGMRITLFNLAVVATRSGDFEPARRYLAEALRIVRELGSKQLAPDSFEILGELAAALHETVRAARMYGAAQVVRETTGESMTPEDTLHRDQAIRELRSGLGEDRFRDLVREGRELSFESAIDDALAWLEGRAPSPSTP